jgi:hypothetical protein
VSPFYSCIHLLCIILQPLAFSSRLLGQSSLDALKDLDLDTGLGLVLLGSTGSDHSLGIGETGSDGLGEMEFRDKMRVNVGCDSSRQKRQRRTLYQLTTSVFLQYRTDLGGELVHLVSLNSVDGHRVVGVYGSESGRD